MSLHPRHYNYCKYNHLPQQVPFDLDRHNACGTIHCTRHRIEPSLPLVLETEKQTKKLLIAFYYNYMYLKLTKFEIAKNYRLVLSIRKLRNLLPRRMYLV